MSKSKSGREVKGSAGPPQDRKKELVGIAYRLIAAKGFEGFRVRAVATEAGINNATLHHYFPTKEALIQAVVDSLVAELRISRAPDMQVPGELSALDELRAEFEDIRVRLRHTPDQLVVLTELSVRSWRDPSIAAILRGLDQAWRGHLVRILERGMRDRAFRADLDPQATASALMLQLRGIGAQVRLPPDQLDHVVNQLRLQTERWVLD